jgi:alanine dehydrogenase
LVHFFEYSEVFVDTYAGVLGEGGDLLQAIAEGAFSEQNIRADLAQLVRNQHEGRSGPNAITVFKSVGASLEDLAAAIEVWEQMQ